MAHGNPPFFCMVRRNYLADAAAYLQRKLEGRASVDILYRVEGREPVPMRAIVGQMITAQEDVNGMISRSVVRDFTISQQAFTRAFGVNARPQRYDEIVYRVGGVEQRYIVSSDDYTTAEFEESDGYGEAFRVHTKKDASYAT